MSVKSRLLIFSISLILISSMFAGCGGPADNTLDPADIQIVMEPSSGSGIEPEDLKVTVTDVKIIEFSLDKNYPNPWFADHKSFKAGEPCLLVSGSITNDSPVDLFILPTGWGEDSSGQFVSASLESAAGLVGAGSSSRFQFLMNWYDDISIVHIRCQASTTPYPQIPGNPLQSL